MLATISASTFDLDGHVEIQTLPTTDLGETRRRVNRVATLDGGAAVNDFGHAWADQTINLRWQPISDAEEAAISALLRNHAQVVASTQDGVFLAAPESYQYQPGESRITLLVLGKLSA